MEEDDPDFIKKKLAQKKIWQEQYDKYRKEELDRIIKKSDENRFERRLQTERLETELEDRLLRAEITDKMRKEKLRKEEQLVEELYEKSQEELKEMKLRKQIRETSVEIRELESKLRAAYVNKTLQAQLAEKKARESEDKVRLRLEAQIMQESMDALGEEEKQKEFELFQKKMNYKAELQDQILMKQNFENKEYETFVKDKIMLDEVIQRVNEEEKQNCELKKLMQKKAQEEIEEFKKAQGVWQERQRKDMEEEEKRREDYLNSRKEYELKVIEEEERRKEEKSKAFDLVAKSFIQNDTKAKEKEEMIQYLIEQEENMKALRREQEELENKWRLRMQLRDEHKWEMEQKIEKFKLEEKLDNEYKLQIIEQSKQNMKMEQLSTERRRLKMVQLRKEAEFIIEERRKKRAEEMESLKLLHAKQVNDTNEWARKIKEERIKILQEHAQKLNGIFPKGILNKEDLLHLDPAVVERYENPQKVQCSELKY